MNPISGDDDVGRGRAGKGSDKKGRNGKTRWEKKTREAGAIGPRLYRSDKEKSKTQSRADTRE